MDAFISALILGAAVIAGVVFGDLLEKPVKIAARPCGDLFNESGKTSADAMNATPTAQASGPEHSTFTPRESH